MRKKPTYEVGDLVKARGHRLAAVVIEVEKSDRWIQGLRGFHCLLHFNCFGRGVWYHENNLQLLASVRDTP